MAVHPDRDTLADLAAEVLPEAQARVVEAHVIGCEDCAGLLADAEHVRRILIADDPGPMPIDVWNRISNALATEAEVRLYGVPDDAYEPAPVEDHAWGRQEWLTQEWPAASAALSAELAAQDDAVIPLPQFDDAPTLQWQRFAEGVDGVEPSQALHDQQHGHQHGHQHQADDTLANAWHTAADDLPDDDLTEAALVGDDDAADDVDAAPGRVRGSRGSDSRGGGSRGGGSRGGGSRSGGGRSIASRTGAATRSLSSRRELRDDQRSPFLARFARPLTIAAGVIVVGGLGLAFATHSPFGGGGDVTAASQSTSEAAVAAAGGGPAAPQLDAGQVRSLLTSSGTQYNGTNLQAKALALVKTRPGTTADKAAGNNFGAAPSGSGAGAGATLGSTTKDAPPPVGAAPSAGGLRITGNSKLADPAALASCLVALNAADQAPLAVDFATYEGQEAAILVLLSRDGGYEVWVVRRDCHDKAGGQLAYLSVTPTP